MFIAVNEKWKVMFKNENYTKVEEWVGYYTDQYTECKIYKIKLIAEVDEFGIIEEV